MVLLRSQLEEAIESVASFYSCEVGEVAGLDPSEDCEDLVDGELLAAQRWRRQARFGWKEPGVGSRSSSVLSSPLSTIGRAKPGLT